MGGAWTESTTIQAGLASRLAEPDMGWEEVAADDLDRDVTNPMVESGVIEALVRLNPQIREKPERVDEVLPKLRATSLSVGDEGLVAANERMIDWLRGWESVKFIGEDQATPIALIDFDDPRANRLVLSREVTYQAGTEEPRRFDLVLWVNGFPLVIGETKTPFTDGKSWLTAASDIEAYERLVPAFFVSNVLSFATEGKEFRYGAVGEPAEMWLPWGKTDEPLDPPGLKRAQRAAELLLTPEMVLDLLRTYSQYSLVRIGQATTEIKILGRYQQVEAVEALTERAKHPTKRQGLIWHHQGSGKTFLMAFACAKLRREIPGATVLVIVDRLDLIEQTTREFESVGVSRLRIAETRAQLQEMLANDQRGVIITTIHRFHNAGLLNERDDIIALIDEAHRTQEGTLGMDMRKAIPNATRIGLTGTPISEVDRDTFENFGDPDDPDWVINVYSAERAMADGATLPIRVEAPRPDLKLDKKELDQAFDELAEEEGLTEAEKEQLARKASKTKTLFKADARVKAICADIVDHYYRRVSLLGLKAQVVAFDRELCVLYQAEIARLLKERGDEDQVTVVMTTNGKQDPEEWLQYDRDRAEEAKVKARFRDPHDPLRFLIVTAKLLTGFDAPIEGVMYLDKPLKKHTLFQAMTRTNRRWTNPDTKQEKTNGLIVDYVGLGKEIAAAMNIKKRPGEEDQLDLDALREELRAALQSARERFATVDFDGKPFEVLLACQEVLAVEAERDAFAREFLKIEALFEFLWPDEDLREERKTYKLLAKVYDSIQPAIAPDALLWKKLGAKTLALINQHVVAVDVRGAGVATVTIDEETLEALRKLGVETGGDHEDGGEPGGVEPPSAEEIIDSIEKRIERHLQDGDDDPKYRSLADRLDRLRKMQVVDAQDSIEFLKAILQVARDVVATDRESFEGIEGEGEAIEPDGQVSLLPEQRIGALTQIFNEYRPDATPEIVERVVAEIDAVVVASRFTRWQTNREGTRTVKNAIRKALKKFELPATGELFDRAYDYVAEHY